MNLLYANDQRGAYPSSWYAETATPLDPLPVLEGDTQADVAIVGAGFTGLSAALHLAQAGMDVVVLEAQRVGFGASGRNGGQVWSGMRLGQDQLEMRYGADDARKLWDLSVEAGDLTRALVAAHAPEANYKAGLIAADWDKGSFEHTKAEVDHLATTYGADIRVLDRPELHEIVGSPGYVGGYLDMGSGHLHPLRYAFGLARAARAAGVRIYEQSEVVELRKGSSVRLRTPKGTLRAAHTILACNGYIGALEPDIAARVMPINSFVATTEPLGDRADSVLSKDFAVGDNKFVVNYFRLTEDKRLLFGGGEGYTHRFPDDIAAKVRKPLEEVFPHLAGVELTHAWGGTLGISLSRMPVFRKVDTNILSASGFSGQGVALAGFAGKVMAEAVRGPAGQFDTFAALPQPRFPGGPRLRAPLLFLAMSWYALRDRMGI